MAKGPSMMEVARMLVCILQTTADLSAGRNDVMLDDIFVTKRNV